VRRTAVALAVASAGLAAPARAETDLRLRDLPRSPIRLAMRRPAAAAPAPVVTAPPIVLAPSRPAARPIARPAARPIARPAAAARATRVNRTVAAPAGTTTRTAPTSFSSETAIFRLDLGYGVDGAGLQDNGISFGEGQLIPPDQTGTNYTPVRGYGWADLYAGTRGWRRPWLNTYLATHWQITGGTVNIAPLPTVYDRADHVPVRSAWMETDGIFRQRWLAPLRVRAGRQYVYGAAPAHLDGITLAWEARGIELRYSVGAVVREYETVTIDAEQDSTYGAADVRVDLGAWWRSLPVVLSVATLGNEHDHTEWSVAYARPDRDVVVRAAVRTLDGERARETLTGRFLLRDIAQLTVDVVHRTANDWRWGPSWVRDDETTASQRYLDLGPVRPRLEGSARLGFTWMDNIDVLVRGGGAADLGGGDEPTGPFAPGWVELGGTAEGRLRRALALGVTGLTRSYRRPRNFPVIEDIEADGGAEELCAMVGAGDPSCAAQPFPTELDHLGEVAFHELGGHLRYSAGARRFSARAEVFWRRTNLTDLYVDDDSTPNEEDPQTLDTSRDTEDHRVGGRFSIEASPTSRLRVRAEYELTTLIETALEIRGYKSLRLHVEASF
jgi:hypothetical protein